MAVSKEPPAGPAAAGAAPVFFADAGRFRAWLARHGAQAKELIVGYHKVGSGQPSMTWPESVDEALCVGWIDGVRRRIDDARYQIRFTPRRKGSIWSAVNVARVQALTAEGRMQPAGLAAFEARIERKTAVYAYEQSAEAALTAAELRAFKRRKAAWAWFESAAPSYRKVALHWVTSAKQPQTRARRFERLLQACTDGQRMA